MVIGPLLPVPSWRLADQRKQRIMTTIC